MTLSEIREIFNQDIVARRLSKVEEQLNFLTTSQQASRYISEISEKIKSGIYPRFLSINKGDTLAEVTTERSLQEIGEKPFFRIAVTPANPQSEYINVESEEIKKLLNNPPGSRYGGWNMEGNFRLERFEEGIHQGTKETEYLELMSNGHMEFWTPLGEQFCWRQSSEEFRIKPRLYFYPVIEYPTTFLRLYRAILDVSKINDELFVNLIYANLKGYTINPTPDRFGFAYFSETKTFKGKHLIVQKKFAGDFGSDEAAYNLIREVYAAFGLEAKMIPFYKKDGKFEFPSS
jgi:hypothetical protein